MENAVVVQLDSEMTELIIFGANWLPSLDILDSCDSIEKGIKEIARARRGKETLGTAGEIALTALAREIPTDYQGAMELEIKLRSRDGK